MSPSKLAEDGIGFDYVVIAIEDPSIAEMVKKNLMKKNISADKIIWKKYR